MRRSAQQQRRGGGDFTFANDSTKAHPPTSMESSVGGAAERVNTLRVRTVHWRGQKRGDRKGETYTNGEKIGQSREVGGKMAHKVVCAYEMGKFSTTRFGGTGCAHVFQCVYCLPCESTSLCSLPFHPPARSCLHSR